MVCFPIQSATALPIRRGPRGGGRQRLLAGGAPAPATSLVGGGPGLPLGVSAWLRLRPSPPPRRVSGHDLPAPPALGALGGGSRTALHRLVPAAFPPRGCTPRPSSAAPLPYPFSPPAPPEPPTRPRAPATSSAAGAEDFIALRGLRRARREAPALVWPAEPRPGRGCWVLHDRALGSPRPCAGKVRPGDTAGRASLSPVEIKHRMGMGGGVWQRPGLDWGGSSCARPGGGCVFQLLPLTRAYIQRWHESGVAAVRPLRSPRLGPSGTGKREVLGLDSWAGGEGARVTLPCLENINLHVKVRAGPGPATGSPRPWRQDHGAVQNGSGEGAGAQSSRRGASRGTRWGGRQQVWRPGDVEIC